ncbi:MAG: NAD(+) diphosphatase [Fulvimonas sp.]|nr:NAD(+) diphosphatase [Fulvimonas sp.]
MARDATPNVFAGLSRVFDRAAERREDEAWVAAQIAAPAALFLPVDAGGRTWLRADGSGLRWLDNAERLAWLPDRPVSLLGLLAGQPFFLLTLDEARDAERLDAMLGGRRADLREAGLTLSAAEAALFAYAKGLAHWQRETRHCSLCGAPLVLVASGHRARCTAAACARLHFPRTDAAIIVLVEHEGACLLGRQPGWPPGRYSTLAGFVEPGESLEDAVRREVAEEAGVTVDDVQYHSSQPWPMPASLMVGFKATAVDRGIQLRDGELEDARWFTPQALLEGLAAGSFVPPMRLSVAYRLIADWLYARAGIELGRHLPR